MKRSLITLSVLAAMSVTSLTGLTASAEMTTLWDDNLANQEVDAAPEGYRSLKVDDDGTSTMKENCSGVAWIEANPVLPSGKCINNYNNNMYAQLNGKMDMTGMDKRIYYLSWNQYIAENQEEDGAYSKNRASALRFFEDEGGCKSPDENLKLQIGTTHFNGTHLDVYGYGEKSYKDTASLPRGKWYTFKALLYANQDNTAAKDGFDLRVYEYGTTKPVAAFVNKNVNLASTINWIQPYLYGSDKVLKKFSDLKIETGVNSAQMESLIRIAEAADTSSLKTISADTDFEQIINDLNAWAQENVNSGIDKYVDGYEWISNNTDIISNAQNAAPTVTLPAEDTDMCLTLRIKRGTEAYTDIYIPTTVKAAVPVTSEFTSETTLVGAFTDDFDSSKFATVFKTIVSGTGEAKSAVWDVTSGEITKTLKPDSVPEIKLDGGNVTFTVIVNNLNDNKASAVAKID